VLIIQVAAAVLLLLGSGLIFKALVEMDTPRSRPRPLSRRSLPGASADADTERAIPVRRAA